MIKKIFLLLLMICVVEGIVSGEEKFPFVGVVTTNHLNIRAGQSTNFESLGQLNEGDSVVVVSKSFSWYKIRLPLKIPCFISSRFVQMRIDNIGMVVGHIVNVRSRANEKSSVLGKLKKGEKVLVKGQEGQWYKIEPVQGVFGYVSDQFVRFKSMDVPAPKVIREPTRNIYKRKVSHLPVNQPSSPSPQVKRVPEKKEKTVSAVGRLEDLGRIYLHHKEIRHKLVIQGETKYYLEGSYPILDSLINQRVKVVGKLKDYPGVPFQHPVLVVSTITLAL